MIPLAAGQVHVYRVGLAARQEIDRPDLLAEWAILSPEEQGRALRFVRPRDGRRFVLCRAALRLILGGFAGVAARDLAFRFGPGGKPELAETTGRQCLPLPRFNLTHSDDLALIALSVDRELGVDLERRKDVSQADRIVESYFTPAEQAQYAALDEPARPEAFLRGWTRKEAILKARGVGLAGLASGYETLFGTEALAADFQLARPVCRIREWTLWEAAPGDDYVAALAVGASHPSDAGPLSRNLGA